MILFFKLLYSDLLKKDEMFVSKMLHWTSTGRVLVMGISMYYI